MIKNKIAKVSAFIDAHSTEILLVVTTGILTASAYYLYNQKEKNATFFWIPDHALKRIKETGETLTGDTDYGQVRIKLAPIPE